MIVSSQIQRFLQVTLDIEAGLQACRDGQKALPILRAIKAVTNKGSYLNTRSIALTQTQANVQGECVDYSRLSDHS